MQVVSNNWYYNDVGFLLLDNYDIEMASCVYV